MQTETAVCNEEYMDVETTRFGVVRVESPLRISTRTVSSPALESQKAVAVPTMPPPMTTASAVWGNSSSLGVMILFISKPLLVLVDQEVVQSAFFLFLKKAFTLAAAA